MLLPLIGEGWDGECPARALLPMRHSEQRSEIQNPLQPQPESPASIEGFKIYSVLCNSSNYATLNQVQSDKKRRHSGLYKANRRSEVRTSEPVCRTDPVSPTSSKGFKLILSLFKPFNYAIPGRSPE